MAMWAEKLSRVARTIRSSSLEVYRPRAPLGRAKGEGRVPGTPQPLTTRPAWPERCNFGSPGAIAPFGPFIRRKRDVGVRRCTLGGTWQPKRSSRPFQWTYVCAPFRRKFLCGQGASKMRILIANTRLGRNPGQ
jgi:hypothetical protein